MVLLMTGFSSGNSFIVLSRMVASPLFIPSDTFCFHTFLLSARACYDLVLMLGASVSDCDCPGLGLGTES